MPLVERRELTVLFTQRATQLRNHAGQISFPGGRIESADGGPVAAALREAREEIGLAARFVSVIGYLPDHLVNTGFRVTPVVAFVQPDFELLLDAQEVQDTFEVPLGFLFDPANHHRHRRRATGSDEEVEFFRHPLRRPQYLGRHRRDAPHTSIGCVSDLPMSDAERALSALLALMARLRDPQRGCPWDREQTFSSIAPYTIEEAYEVADAIERGEHQQLRDELGDLLFQVVFQRAHGRGARLVRLAAVATAIHDKLVRRHPHVFAGASPTPEELVRVWEEQKAQERAESAASRPAAEGTVLAGVPRAFAGAGARGQARSPGGTRGL